MCTCRCARRAERRFRRRSLRRRSRVASREWMVPSSARRRRRPTRHASATKARWVPWGGQIPPRTVARLEEWATITILSRAAAAQRQRAAGARGATVLCSERFPTYHARSSIPTAIGAGLVTDRPRQPAFWLCAQLRPDHARPPAAAERFCSPCTSLTIRCTSPN